MSISVATLKQAAFGKERMLLSTIGIMPNHLNGKHQACPACGGKDRFRWDKKKDRYVVGRITGTEKVLIAEGYATAVSLHLHYQKPVIVAFTAGNLANVISSIRSIYPLLPLVICADNDMHKVSGNKVNVGVSYARESVRRFKGIELLIPAFSYELCQEKTDFNDLCVFGSGKFKHIKVENEYVVTRESFIQHVNYNFTEDLRIIQ